MANFNEFQLILLQTTDKLLYLWYHENLRVFNDRLVNDDDRKWFEQILQKILREKFENSFSHTNFDTSTLFYGSFCGTNEEYERIVDLQKV